MHVRGAYASVSYAFGFGMEVRHNDRPGLGLIAASRSHTSMVAAAPLYKNLKFAKQKIE